MKLHFVADKSAAAQSAWQALTQMYQQSALPDAEVIVALGGDGFMLETLHETIASQQPVYGMNCGSIGFLMNRYKTAGLIERIKKAKHVILHPLAMSCEDIHGQVTKTLAINEVSLFRESRQAAKICISVNGVVRLDELICDGVLLATPAGSTAYNLSAHGPIIPIGAKLLALTPISAFRPRRWRGALLPDDARVTLEVLEPDKRPAIAAADFTEVRDPVIVDITINKSITINLLFDHEHNLEERIVNEQFLT